MDVMSVWSVAMAVFHCEGGISLRGWNFLCNREAPNVMTKFSLNLSVY